MTAPTQAREPELRSGGALGKRGQAYLLAGHPAHGGGPTRTSALILLDLQLPQRWQSKRCWAVCRSSLAYAFVDGGIVVRTHDDSQLFSAARDSVVALQVDAPRGSDGGGWSVHMTGLAQEVTDPVELARLRALPHTQLLYIT